MAQQRNGITSLTDQDRRRVLRRITHYEIVSLVYCLTTIDVAGVRYDGVYQNRAMSNTRLRFEQRMEQPKSNKRQARTVVKMLESQHSS